MEQLKENNQQHGKDIWMLLIMEKIFSHINFNNQV